MKMTRTFGQYPATIHSGPMTTARPCRARLVQSCALAVIAAMAMMLGGCGSGLMPEAHNGGPTTRNVLAGIHGVVHGGQQPVSGAVIQLYAVGMSGLKSASTPLIYASVGTVTTGPDGSFSITGEWDCTSNTAAYGTNPLLYLTATGGNPGLQGSVNNSASLVAAALGPCSGVGASTFININELTTVAMVYAVAPFMADATHVGAQGANAVGLVNAFSTAGLLVNVATGSTPGATAGSNVTLPMTELNSLADALASCVNSSGTTGECAALFAAATPSGGTQPTNIVGAALSIAANPASQVAGIYNTTEPKAPFQPTLSAVPNDWTMGIKFTGGGLASPAGLALDAAGNVWVANAAGNSVTELSSTGVPISGSLGYTAGGSILGAQGIAVDRAGNVWVANTLAGNIVELTLSGGSVLSSATYTKGIAGPIALAIDSGNNVWVSNFAGSSVTELNSQGAVVGSGPLTAMQMLEQPAGIAIDAQGNVWVADNASWDVVEFANNQTLLSGGYSDGGMVAPLAVAMDAKGRAWIADNGSNGASLLAADGRPVTVTPFTGGGLAMPAAVAVDGSGVAWLANGTASGSVSEVASGQSVPLSPAAGYGVMNTPMAVAIDASGSLWTANAGDNSVIEIVGLATPVVLPLAARAGP